MTRYKFTDEGKGQNMSEVGTVEGFFRMFKRSVGMNKMILNKTIGSATSEDLLYALIYRNGIDDGPRKTVYGTPHKETLVAIGDDATAFIRIDADDVALLTERVCGNER